MSDFTLCVCYPTYNRGLLFVQDIKDVLAINDGRFCISIQDNCSNDGSFELLNCIIDTRLKVRRNNTNIGGVANTYQAIRDIEDSEYILFCLDKDKVIPSELSEFIDFLEIKHPFSGFIDLYSNNCTFSYEKYTAGISSLIHTAYLSRHPSGFFWRTEEANKFMMYLNDATMSSFPFSLDTLQAEFAKRYDSYIIKKPIILHAPFRKDYMKNRSKTLTYNESNIYFSFSKRIEAFRIYLSHLYVSSDTYRVIIVISYNLLFNLLYQVSIGLKKTLMNEGDCWHYNISPRNVSFRERFNNIKKSVIEYLFRIKSPVSFIMRFFIVTIATIRIIAANIRYEVFTK